MYSLSSVSGADYFFKQAVFVVFGTGVMFFITFLDYRHIQKYSTLSYFLILLILLLVLFFGRTVNGTSGWISFGLFQIQPVEFSKIVLILFLANFISKKKSELGEWARIIASFILSLFLIFLVLKQPDLGSSLVLSALWVGMILASGLRVKHFIILFLLGLTLIIGSWSTLADYQKDRINTFIHPEFDPRGSGYNVLQAIVAVGSGGITGKGIGHGSQSQLNFLPERHTDFIFAVISEELGLVGSFFVILIYGFILYRIKHIGEVASDNFGYLVSVGIFIMFFVQIIINIGMNVGVMPVTGIPAPFLSYGGSSLLTTFISLGLLLNIYQKRQDNHDLHISLEKSFLD